MPETEIKATIQFAGDDVFVGLSPSGHAQVVETNSHRSRAATPMELLLLALGSCTGVDVISILKKKRQRVTDYRIEVSGERREDHPRAYTGCLLSISCTVVAYRHRRSRRPSSSLTGSTVALLRRCAGPLK